MSGAEMTSIADRTFEVVGALLLRSRAVLMSLLRRRLDGRETLRLVDLGLRDVLPTALLASVVIGGIVGMQGLGYLTRYAATEVFGWAAAMSAFRDVGPLLFGFTLAARLGTRNTAEVATLAARERLDALAALGLSPTDVVVAPRVIAIVVVAALLYAPGVAVMMVAAFALAAAIGDQNPVISWWSFRTYVGHDILWQGLARQLVFGLVIGLSTTHAGLRLWLSDRRSASDIGGAVYLGSVLSLCAIVVVNLMLSLVGGT